MSRFRFKFGEENYMPMIINWTTKDQVKILTLQGIRSENNCTITFVKFKHIKKGNLIQLLVKKNMKTSLTALCSTKILQHIWISFVKIQYKALISLYIYFEWPGFRFSNDVQILLKMFKCQFAMFGTQYIYILRC